MNTLRFALALLLVVGCRPEPEAPAPPAPEAPPDVSVSTWTTSVDAPRGPPRPRPGPWKRETIDAPGSVRFHELHYHPSGSEAEAEASEWIELHNPLALDTDLSGWSLTGGVEFGFPEHTVLPAGGFLVVAADPATVAGALGPWSGVLSDGGERVELWNNFGRRIDTLGYGDDDPWPVAADGSGLTLAKITPDSVSDLAESWTVSAELGGTPGAANGLDPSAPPTTVELVPLDATWAYDTTGDYPAADWADPGYDDAAWASGEAVFFAGDAEGETAATVRVTADNYYAVYLGGSDGADLRLVAEDVDGQWSTVDSVEVAVGPLDHLYLAAWEAPADYGGPQMAIAEVDTPTGVVGTDATGFEWVLGPPGRCPGTPSPPPATAEVAVLVAVAESRGAWAPPAVEADRASAPWGVIAGSFDPATRYVWPDTFADTSVTNVENTYVLLRSREPLLGDRGATELGSIPTTSTFRTPFSFDGDPAAAALTLECLLDDGAVVYLNGVEVLRENLPAGALDAGTLATAEVGDAEPSYAAISSAALARGPNVLAVELHQATPSDPDLTFGCALTASITQRLAGPTLLFDEVAPLGEASLWVDLLDVGADAVELEGLVIASSTGGEQVLPAGTLAPGERRTVDLGLPVAEGDVLFLYSEDRLRLLDAVRVGSALRGRAAGGAAWRYPSWPTPGAENRIDLVDDVVIDEILYHHAPISREGEPVTDVPEEWIELTNRGPDPVDLGGWQLVDAVAFTFPEGTVLAPGAFLVVARDAAALRAEHPEVTVLGDLDGALANGGDRILLLDVRGNPADEVRYFDGGRWPDAADGGGSTLELRDLWADNSAAEAWAASDEGPKASWATYRYRGTADPSAVGPDGQWRELVVGLLDAGEVLIDDLSVVRDPDGSPVEVLQNGTFDAGSAAWRLLGNHRHAEVVPDPDDPSDPVLRLVATGPTGHMHNHAETTLTRPIVELPYEVSFRARWVSGSNQLNTRLYFNRLPRTTLVEQPQSSGTPGAANSTAVPNLGPTFSDLGQDVAVPDPLQPVRIGVTVDDPDGVASVALFTSVDGGAFEEAAMVEGVGGRWEGLVDGRAAGTLVQFYLEALDGEGDVAAFPAGGPDSRALLTWDDGRAATHGLHNLRILLTPDDDAWLHDDVNLMSDDLVGATVIYDESRVFRDVGVRTKGSERGRPEVPRLGYGVSFHAEERFRGNLGSVLVDRSEGVGYGQREVLMNLVMTHAGSVSGEYNDLVQAITPRPEHTGPAELQLDRATNLLLASQFLDGDTGPAFEYELVYYPLTTDDGTPQGHKLPQPDSVIGTAITDLGDDREAYRWNFLLQNNERVDDYARIVDLGKTFALPTPSLLVEAGAVIDVDEWLRAFAFATLSGAVDNYGGDGSQHNARFYVRPEDGRVLYFPHDLDFYGGYTGPVVGNGDLARLLQDPVNVRTYYGHLQDIVFRAYNETWLGPWCDQLGALLAPQNFRSHCTFVGDRAEWVMRGAPDAVFTRFPRTDFRITTAGGQDFSVDAAEVVLEGEAWIDVREIALDGATEPLPLTWIDATRWRVTVPLVPGPNDLILVATDLRDAEVGSDVVVVTSRP